MDTDKRTFNFILFALLVFSLWFLIDSQLNPRKNKPKNDPVAESEEKKVEGEDPADATPTEAEQPEKQTVARQHLTIGSLDSESGYPMLVTFDNRGGAVERIELAGDRYHDMERRGGYLGSLTFVESDEPGLVVDTVGAGTPAFIAGLKSGDRILSIQGEPIASAVELHRYLDKKTKPKDEVDLEIERGAAPNATKLTIRAVLTRTPLAMVQLEDNSIANSFVDREKPADPFGPPSFRLALKQLGTANVKSGADEIGKLKSLHNSNWNANVLDDGVEFTLDLDEADLQKIGQTGALRITKRYRLPKLTDGAPGPKQHLSLEVEIENRSESDVDLAYRLEGPNGLPLEGWWYYVKVHPGWSGAGARDVAYNLGGKHDLAGLPAILSESEKRLADKETPSKVLLGPNDERRLRYIGVDTQYFAVAMLPEAALERNAANPGQFSAVLADAYPLNRSREKLRNKITNISFRLTSATEKLPPGAKLSDKYVIFAGPKEGQLLDEYGLSRLIEFGWFGAVSKLLSKILWILRWGTGSYGIAIILLTVLVRGAMLPISIRQAKSMAKMQALQPEIDKIKEKHKGDAVKQQSEVSELWRKHNVNPLGGCGPMFLQIPVFIGLYRCLSSDINMRETPLIQGVEWCANLAGPDFLFSWKEHLPGFIADEANGWLGPYFNILPLFTTALFIIQQKMFTPPPANEEQELQQKIMTYMTVFMGVMFYKVPAGLCIYFITSSLWGIVERKMLPKPAKKPDGTFDEPDANKSAPAKPTDETKGIVRKESSEPSMMERFSTWVNQLNDAAEGKGASRETRTNGRDANPKRKDSSGDRPRRKERER